MNLTSKRMIPFLTVLVGVCALSASAQTRWVDDNFEAEGTGYTNAQINQAAGTYKMSTWGTLGNENTNLVWFADQGDASKIVATTPAYSGVSKRPMEGSTTAQSLELATEGQTLMRPMYVDGVTGSVPFTASSIYVDTLIKFTPSEDDPEITDGLIKIAMFVNVNSNLVVRHKTTYDGGFNYVTTNSVFESLGKINPDQWYRLTIKLSGPALFNPDPAFQVYLDGTMLTHANGLTSEWGLDGSYFLMMHQDTTLSQISFQGTGAVDELVVADTVDLTPPSSLTLTLSFNDALLDVFIDGNPVANNDSIASGATLNINAIDWYQIEGVTGTGITYTGTTGSLVNVSTGDITADEAGRTATIAAVQYTGTIPTGLPGDYANVPADKLAAWAVNSGLTEAQVLANAADYLDNYLLNIDESISADLEITSIVVDPDNEIATITVAATSAAVDFTELNGTLVVWTSDDLTAWGEPVSYAITLELAAEVTIEIPYAAGNFIKARVE